MIGSPSHRPSPTPLRSAGAHAARSPAWSTRSAITRRGSTAPRSRRPADCLLPETHKSPASRSIALGACRSSRLPCAPHGPAWPRPGRSAPQSAPSCARQAHRSRPSCPCESCWLPHGLRRAQYGKRAQADIAAFSVCLHSHDPTATARADQIEHQALDIGIAARLFEVPDLDCCQHSHRSKAFPPHIRPHTPREKLWNT